MPEKTAVPLDAAQAAAAAYEAVKGRPFPDDIFTAPQLTWAVIGCGVIANQMADALALAGRRIHGVANRTHEKAVAFAEHHGVDGIQVVMVEVSVQRAHHQNRQGHRERAAALHF